MLIDAKSTPQSRTLAAYSALSVATSESEPEPNLGKRPTIHLLKLKCKTTKVLFQTVFTNFSTR